MKDFFIAILCMGLCFTVWVVLVLNDANKELKARPSMVGCQCPAQKLCKPVIKVEKPNEVIVYKETIKRDCRPCEASEVCDYSHKDEQIEELNRQLLEKILQLKEALLQLKLNCR